MSKVADLQALREARYAALQAQAASLRLAGKSPTPTTQPTPAKAAPTKAAPAKAAPTKSTPAKPAPVVSSDAPSVPVEAAFANPGAVQATPPDQAETTPATTSVSDGPVSDGPVSDGPASDGPASKAPATRSRRAATKADSTPIDSVSITPAAAPDLFAEAPDPMAGLCGHRSIGSKVCMREAGHKEKSHRYK